MSLEIFGDINIDSQFLVAVEEDMIELINGRICCMINNSLTDAVYRVLDGIMHIASKDLRLHPTNHSQHLRRLITCLPFSLLLSHG